MIYHNSFLGGAMKRNILLIMFSVILCAECALYAADIIAAPNPWVPNGGKTRTGTPAGGINFMNLPTNGSLNIYTISGNLVLKQPLISSAGAFNWNGRNGSGVDVASGVYLWVINSSEGTRTGKLIIVR
jgi:hypothetical protein